MPSREAARADAHKPQEPRDSSSHVLRALRHPARARRSAPARPARPAARPRCAHPPWATAGRTCAGPGARALLQWLQAAQACRHPPPPRRLVTRPPPHLPAAAARTRIHRVMTLLTCLTLHMPYSTQLTPHQQPRMCLLSFPVVRKPACTSCGYCPCVQDCGAALETSMLPVASNRLLQEPPQSRRTALPTATRPRQHGIQSNIKRGRSSCGKRWAHLALARLLRRDRLGLVDARQEEVAVALGGRHLRRHALLAHRLLVRCAAAHAGVGSQAAGKPTMPAAARSRCGLLAANQQARVLSLFPPAQCAPCPMVKVCCITTMERGRRMGSAMQADTARTMAHQSPRSGGPT